MPGSILCLEQFSNLGGGQLALVDLLPAFRDRGANVRVALPGGDGPLAGKLRRLDFAVDTLSLSPYSNGHKTLLDAARYAFELPGLRRAIQRLIAAHRVDLIYVNGPRLLPAASLAARRMSVPLLFHCHNRIAQSAAASLAGSALRLARARILACSRFAAEPLTSHTDPDLLSVLYNGVAPLAPPDKIPARTVRHIGVIGRIDPEKGQLAFIEAAHSLIRQFPGCTFSIVGAPSFSNHRYFDQVIQASAGLPMTFTGWRDDIANVFAELDLLVVPSTPLDAAPRVILEAFAARVPVIASASGGIPEIVEDNVNGFLAPPDALMTRITDVLTMDYSRLCAVVDRAYKSWQTNYTLDAYRRRVTDLLVWGRLETCGRLAIGRIRNANP